MVHDPPILPSPRARCSQLLRELKSRPDDGWAWLWRIHLRISSFVARRDASNLAEPMRSIGGEVLDDLKQPYVDRAAPTLEEMRLRSRTVEKVRRVMRGFDDVGAHVRDEAMAEAARTHAAIARDVAAARALMRVFGAAAVAVCIGMLAFIGAVVELLLLSKAWLFHFISTSWRHSANALDWLSFGCLTVACLAAVLAVIIGSVRERRRRRRLATY